MSNTVPNIDFKQWLVSLKTRIRQSQIKAAIRVNEELLRLYWDLGHDIVVRQMDSAWGSGFFEQLSQELRSEFPDMNGFSGTNLKYCKRFYQFYTQDKTIRHQLGVELQNDDNQYITIRQQVVDEISQQVGAKLQNVDNQDVTIYPQVGGEFKVHPIFQIPWRHHVEIITKCKTVAEALFYVRKTIENGWSRAVLMNFLDTDLYRRQGKALNNFDRLLPDAQSDLAKEILKAPYNLDFLTLAEGYKERELEIALSENMKSSLPSIEEIEEKLKEI